MHLYAADFEEFIVLRAVLCCHLQTDVTVKDEIVVDLNVLPAVDIDTVSAQIVFAVLQIGVIALGADAVDDIVVAGAVPDKIKLIGIGRLAFCILIIIRVFGRSLEPDHIDPDIVILMDDIITDLKPVNIAVKNGRLAVAALTIIDFTTSHCQVFDRRQIIAGVHADPVCSPHAMHRAVSERDLIQRLITAIACAFIKDPVCAALDLKAFHRDIFGIDQMNADTIPFTFFISRRLCFDDDGLIIFRTDENRLFFCSGNIRSHLEGIILSLMDDHFRAGFYRCQRRRDRCVRLFFGTVRLRIIAIRRHMDLNIVSPPLILVLILFNAGFADLIRLRRSCFLLAAAAQC